MTTIWLVDESKRQRQKTLPSWSLRLVLDSDEARDIATVELQAKRIGVELRRLEPDEVDQLLEVIT